MHVGAVTSGEDDARLMHRVQADERGAFGALYDRFSPRAYGLAYAVIHDRARAEDSVQDAFVSVWRNRAAYRPEAGSVASWVLSIVRHRAIDTIRRHARHDDRRADEDVLGGQAALVSSVEDVVGERDEAARLRSTLCRLPDAQRDVIALAYFGELSTTEIATQLSLPVGTVKGRMRLGLDKLRATQVS